MKIVLEPNAGSDNQKIPYFACAEIATLTIDSGSVFQVPVHLKQMAYKKIYDVEICGFRLETDTLDNIPALVEKLLSGLVNMTRLPSYVFIARRSRGIYPVYTVGNEVFATTPGGPVFRHVELAKVREYLNDYLHEMGILGKPGMSDKLHVRGVNTKTLGVIRPIFYLKKRVPGETEFWAPVFLSDDEGSIYTFAANAKRTVPVEEGKEIFSLHRIVAEVLITDNRLHNVYDLRPERLFPEQWEHLKNILTPLDKYITISDIQIPLYRNGKAFIGLESRLDENRYSLFLGEDIEDVRSRVVRSFTRRGVFDNLITVQAAA
jgi:hypothetical protein